MSSSCLKPLLAINIGTNPDTGKNLLKFKPWRSDEELQKLKDKYGVDNVYLLPCGQCEPCRSNYASEWSIRATLEAAQHSYNYFITLTYSDSCLPYANDKDLKNFIRNLAYKHDYKDLKYLAVKEYGETSQRLHWHIVLFSDFELTLTDPTKINGIYYYHSPEVAHCWRFGLFNLAPFTTACARYVAKYVNKEGFKPSRLFMSRNLGKSYFDEHKQEIIQNNFKIYGDFQNNKPFVDSPSILIKWFLKDGDIGIAQFLSDQKKELGTIYSKAFMFNNLIKHEEEALVRRQDRFKEKRKEKKRDLL